MLHVLHVSGRFGQRCMEFVRSMPAPRSGCNFGPREQVNQITAWLDGSNVYGSDEEEALKLRLLGGGRLRVTRVQVGKRVKLIKNISI